MKKSNRIKVLTIVLSGTILFSSCLGSFGLFNKVKAWNHEISENKFVNELVFIALHIIPVYEICAIADLLVINSIEFWSGENPMHIAGEVKKIKGENGDYLVESIENGYSIQKEGDTDSIQLLFDKEKQTWNAISEEGDVTLLKLNNDGTATLYLPDGSTLDITLDQQGIVATKKVLMNGYYTLR